MQVKSCPSPKRQMQSQTRDKMPVMEHSCPSPKKGKNKQPLGKLTPVRRSSRLMDALPKGPNQPPLHIDLTDEDNEEILTQESVAWHGGTFRAVEETTSEVQGHNTTARLHAGIVKPMEKPNPK